MAAASADTSSTQKTLACPTFKFKEPRSVAGDGADSQEEKGLVRCAQEVLRAMYADRSMVMPLYNMVLEKRENAENGASAGASIFKSKITTLRSLDSHWVLNYLDSVSDLSVEELVKAKEMDDDAFSCLLSYDVQISWCARLPAACQCHDMMLAFLKKRREMCGNPLATFKADGGLLKSGALDWGKGCFDIEVNAKDSIIAKVTYRKTGDTIDLSGHRISMMQQLRDNWFAGSASLIQPPMPPIRLCTFFKAREGPNAIQNLSKPKAMSEFGAVVEAEVLAARTSATGSSGAKADAKQQLQAMTQKKRQEAAEKAREKAKEHLQKKRARLTITIGSAAEVNIAAP